jgi:hypothetical protein
MTKTITSKQFSADLDASKLSAASAIFTRVDATTAGFADQLAKIGLDRKEAKPYAMAWAAEKYSARLEEGQRGFKLPRNSDAERAYYRVLNAVFPAEASPFAKASSGNADPVAKLLKAFGKLTAGEKRSFKAQLAKV